MLRYSDCARSRLRKRLRMQYFTVSILIIDFFFFEKKQLFFGKNTFFWKKHFKKLKKNLLGEKKFLEEQFCKRIVKKIVFCTSGS